MRRWSYRGPYLHTVLASCKVPSVPFWNNFRRPLIGAAETVGRLLVSVPVYLGLLAFRDVWRGAVRCGVARQYRHVDSQTRNLELGISRAGSWGGGGRVRGRYTHTTFTLLWSPCCTILSRYMYLSVFQARLVIPRPAFSTPHVVATQTTTNQAETRFAVVGETFPSYAGSGSLRSETGLRGALRNVGRRQVRIGDGHVCMYAWPHRMHATQTWRFCSGVAWVWDSHRSTT
ncbi:hypothetical protein F5Y15DRAFT_302514 [Xylariaceae sp. FL0016]|nr:hypothetical protein F5Y15DRAFT_302514 [Xylariaceae sp. FL0016]